MNVSIIVPVYNEEAFMGQFLDQLQAQDYQGKWEAIFADGGSTDTTRDIILARAKEDARMVLIDNPNKYVPFALNAALQHTKGSIIVRMDAHSAYPPNYIRRLTEELEHRHADNVGGVWNTLPGDSSTEAMAIALATTHPLGIGNASYRLGASDAREVDTVPYGCFPRSLFERIGNFDTDLLRNQDDEFNGRIRKNGGKIFLIPDIVIDYHARKTFATMRTMFYQYGLFKPLVNLKLGAPATLRQFAPPVLAAWLFLSPFAALLCGSWWFVPLLPVVLYAFMTAAVSAHLTNTNAHKTKGTPLSLFLLLVVTFPQIHLSYGFGYIFGWIRFGLLKVHRRSNGLLITDNR